MAALKDKKLVIVALAIIAGLAASSAMAKSIRFRVRTPALSASHSLGLHHGTSLAAHAGISRPLLAGRSGGLHLRLRRHHGSGISGHGRLRRGHRGHLRGSHRFGRPFGHVRRRHRFSRFHSLRFKRHHNHHGGRFNRFDGRHHRRFRPHHGALRFRRHHGLGRHHRRRYILYFYVPYYHYSYGYPYYYPYYPYYSRYYGYRGYERGYSDADEPYSAEGERAKESPSATEEEPGSGQITQTSKKVRFYVDKIADAFSASDWAGAVWKAEDAVKAEPDSAELAFLYSQSLFADGRYKKAADVLRGAMSKTSADRTVFSFKELYTGDDVLANQIAGLEKAASAELENADLQLLLGYQLLSVGKFDESLTALQLAQWDPLNVEAAEALIRMLEEIRNGIKQEASQSTQINY